MNDFLFDFFKEDMSLDMVVENSEIQTDESLRSSVLVSLFTDARCEDSEIPIGSKSRGGFWGDAIFKETTGSKLWLLNRSKYVKDTLIKSKEYIEQSLFWMIQDGIAKEIIVETDFNQNKYMEINIFITKNSGEKIKFNFSDAWSYLR